MRKLILFSGLFLFSVSVFAQDETDNKKTIFFRLGTGYGIHFEKIPVPLASAGQKHYRSLRNSLNTNFALGFFVKEDLTVALTYTRVGAKAVDQVGTSQYDSYSYASFIGLVMEKTTALNDKETINFAGRVGPGIVFSRNQTAISVPNVVAKSIVNFSGNGLGVLTGAGFNFKISENLALELNIDKTWGKANNNSRRVTADVLSLGTGLRFAF